MAFMAPAVALWLSGSMDPVPVGLWLGGFQACKAAMASEAFWLCGSMDPMALRPLAAACGSKALRPAWPSGSIACRPAAAPALLSEHQLIVWILSRDFPAKRSAEADFESCFIAPSSDVVLRRCPQATALRHRPQAPPSGHRPQATVKYPSLP
jgi:hypothetical protein